MCDDKATFFVVKWSLFVSIIVCCRTSDTSLIQNGQKVAENHTKIYMCFNVLY